MYLCNLNKKDMQIQQKLKRLILIWNILFVSSIIVCLLVDFSNKYIPYTILSVSFLSMIPLVFYIEKKLK